LCCRSALATALAAGTRRPVSLRIGEVVNQFTARNLTADLQGTWPWSEDAAAVEQRQRRYSRRQADHAAAADAAARPGAAASAKISSSELTSAIKVKQFAMSGPFNGALPLWLDNDKWIINDGWLAIRGR
jgi:hypothetical protein